MSGTVPGAVGSHSIWVMPKGLLAAQLQQQIREVRQQFGGPHFEPHITLLGGIRGSEAQVVQVATRLAATLSPYTLEFQDVHHGCIFHQCVYIRVKPQPDVVEAAARTRAAYGIGQLAPYMPHASLLYSNIQEPPRLELAQQLQARLFTNSGSLLSEAGFTADELAVWYTEEADMSLESWRCVAKIPFSG